MKLNLPSKVLLTLAVFSLRWSGMAYGQTAANIAGLYYTGDNSTGTGLQAGGTTESHWSVTYANVNGTSGNATYEGAAYVVNPIDSGWVANTSTAQWIVPPGAKNSGGTVNAGGEQLPGNGTSTTGGNQEGVYVYTLSFTITGSGAIGTTVTNAVSITLTIAADDQYQVYVNPTLNGSGSVNAGSSTLGGSGTSAWSNTQSVTLQNGTTGTNGNAIFKIGPNTLTIVVDNTNGINSSSTSTALNASGLLVYQVGSAMTIDGKVVPEVGTWMPVVLALGLFFLQRFPRRSPVPV